MCDRSDQVLANPADFATPAPHRELRRRHAEAPSGERFSATAKSRRSKISAYQTCDC